MSSKQTCPCGHLYQGQVSLYSECCEPFITGAVKPDHCEQLMRSRYTAYSLANIDYLISTWHPSKQSSLDRQDLLLSAKSTQWIRLDIVQSRQQGTEGIVEFNAWFKDIDDQHASDIQCLHETSRFEKIDDQWFYLDGEVNTTTSVKVGRNDPCPCGSGKKFKKCCA